MPDSPSPTIVLIVAASAALMITACGAPRPNSPAAAPAPPPATGSVRVAACTKGGMQTLTEGKLTIATDNPVFEPWMTGNDPANGNGYESAVAYAVADRLGYEPPDVTWVRVPFTNASAPGKKEFDFDINQVSITEERAKAVDFSSGYYEVRQAVVTYQGSTIDGTRKLADLTDSKLGAQVGTTSLTAIKEQIRPTVAPRVYDTNDAAVQALRSKLIEGLVVDLPTAFYITSSQLESGVIVGQLPLSGKPEEFGLVLARNSPLTPCVTTAVDGLREDGTLKRLQDMWLTGAGAPELT